DPHPLELLAYRFRDGDHARRAPVEAAEIASRERHPRSLEAQALMQRLRRHVRVHHRSPARRTEQPTRRRARRQPPCHDRPRPPAAPGKSDYFVGSSTWTAIQLSFLVLGALVWLGSATWTWNDARRRSESVLLRLFALGVALAAPGAGVLVYLLVRPQQRLI